MENNRIKPFDVNIEASLLPAEWDTWRQDLESYFVVHKIKTQRDKRAYLVYLGGPGLQGLLKLLPAADKVPHVSRDPPFYDVAVKVLTDHFEPFRRKTYERHLFHKLEQKPGERFADFVMRLRKQIARCGYSAKHADELIADRITAGCYSDDLRNKLLQKDRSLKEILAMGSSTEEVGKHSKKWTTDVRPAVVPDVFKIGARPLERENFQQKSFRGRNASAPRPGQQRYLQGPAHGQNTPRPGQQRLQQGPGQQRLPQGPAHAQNVSHPNRMAQPTCHRCGYFGHTRGDEQCPAFDDTCGLCGRVGHWAVRCFSRTRAKKRSHEESSVRPDTKRIRSVTDETEHRESKDYVFYAMGRNVFTFQVGGVEIPMIIDSGADANIITQTVWEQMKQADVNVLNETIEVDRMLTSYAVKEPMDIIGMFSAEIVAGPNRSFAKFYVVKGGQQCLLGDYTAKDLKVLKVGFDVGAVEGTQGKPFPKMRDVLVEIPIDPNVQPVQQPYRRPPIALEEKIEAKLKSLLDKDIIEPVKGPSSWVSPIVPVIKDNGDIRLCVDMRRANQAVIRETHPLPLVDELLASVDGAVRFSKIDIKDAYHQIEISERSRPITTFLAKKGLYR